jgi:hypothetical protein
MTDKILIYKFEKSTLGGSQDNKRPTPLDPTEDGILAKEFWLVDDETDPYNDTIQQGIKVDANHNLVVYDRVTGSKKLSELASGGGSQTWSEQDATQSNTSSTTLVDRDSLTITNAAAGTYRIEIDLAFDIELLDYDIKLALDVNSNERRSARLHKGFDDDENLPAQFVYHEVLASQQDLTAKIQYATSDAASKVYIEYSNIHIIKVA